MSKKQTYPLELKVKVVRDYDQGLGGYKVLASKYNLSRELVRSWVANAKLREEKLIPVPKDEISDLEKNLTYYREAAAYWEKYARQLEEKLAALTR